MVTEAIFPSGRVRAPTRGLPVSPTRSPFTGETPPGADNAHLISVFPQTPRVDSGSFGRHRVERQLHPSFGSGAVSQGLPSETGTSVPATTLIRGRYVVSDRQPRLTPGSPLEAFHRTSLRRCPRTSLRRSPDLRLPTVGHRSPLRRNARKPLRRNALIAAHLQVSGSRPAVLLRQAPLA